MNNDERPFQEEDTENRQFTVDENNIQNNESKSFFTKKRIILLIVLIIILALIGLVVLGSTPQYNEGDVSPSSSNLTLKYNNDLSNYYKQEISSGKNLGDLYQNVEEYNGVIKLDLLKVNWKETNESNVDYAKSYCIDELQEALKNPNDYNVSITFYDKDGKQLDTKLVGNDITLELSNNLLTVNVDSNKTSDMVTTKNKCSNSTSAKFMLSYYYGNSNYIITSMLNNDTFTVKHA